MFRKYHDYSVRSHNQLDWYSGVNDEGQFQMNLLLVSKMNVYSYVGYPEHTGSTMNQIVLSRRFVSMRRMYKGVYIKSAFSLT